MATLKLDDTSTFITSINWALLLFPGRRANGRQPVAATAEETTTENSNVQQQRLIEQEEKGRTRVSRIRGAGGYNVGGTKERRIPPHAEKPAALSFSRDSLSLSRSLFLPALPCPAFSCELACRIHGEQTGFAIKRILSRNV